MKNHPFNPLLYCIFLISGTLLTASSAHAQLVGYGFRKAITINSSSVSGSSDLTDFPFLVSITDDHLRTTGNGGQVQNSSGFDIAFTASDGSTQLDHDLESFDGTTGTAVIWVRIPTLSASVDTDIFMYYGNSSIDSDQSATTTWSSAYTGVWHLNEDPSGTAPQMSDGTGSNNGTAVNMETGDLITGKLGNAVAFDGMDEYIDVGTLGTFGDDFLTGTFQFWVKTTTTTIFTAMGVLNTGNSTAFLFELNSSTPFGSESEGDTRMFLRSATGTQMASGADVTAFNDGDWHQLTYVRGSGAGNLAIYLDGVATSVTSQANDPTTFNANLSQPMVLGARNNRGTIQQYGLFEMDEVRISTIERSSDWIATEFNNQDDPSGVVSLGSQQRMSQVNGYAFRKQLTIDAALVSGTVESELIDFPVLVSLTDTDLRHITNGGNVTSLSGYDLAFTTSDGIIQLDYELETYDPTTGEILLWVKVPTLSTSVDTDLYLYYGNNAITTDQSSTETWNDGFTGIYHLDEDVVDGATGATHFDATGNNDGTQDGNVEIAGIIGDGQDFDRVSSDKIDIGDPNITNEVTISAWVRHDAITASIIERYVALNNNAVIRYDGANGPGQVHFFLDIGGISSVRVDNILTAGTWFHIAGTWDGTTQTLYINGTPYTDPPEAVGTVDVITSGSFSSGGEPFDGRLDEIHISSVGRSADWIITEYNNQVNPAAFISPAVTEEVVAAPGAVSNNLAIWLKANNGTSTGTDAASLTTWVDQSGTDNIVSESTNPPTFRSNTTDNINYHPVVEFDGVNDVLTDSDGILGGTTYNDLNAYAVIKTTTVDRNFLFIENCTPNRISVHPPWVTGDYYWDAGGTSGANRLFGDWNGTVGTPYLWSNLYSTTTGQTIAGTNQSVSQNGLSILSDATASTFTGTNSAFRLATDLTDFMNVEIAELVLYTGAINAAEHNRIESYLAMKYGLTLDNSLGGTDGDYVASDGTTIWDADVGADYHQQVVVIGRDDASNLLQKQSQTADDSLSLFVGSLTASNIANTGNISNDKGFVAIGNNQLWQEGYIDEVPAGVVNRLERVWKVTNDNFTDDFSIQFTTRDLGTINIADLRLLVDDDGNFSNATAYADGDAGLSITTAPLTFSGISTTHIGTDQTVYISIGSVDAATSLPIELASFTASVTDEDVVLEWTTLTETNNDYFTIERSVNGEDWKELKRIPGAGNSSVRLNYVTVDRQPYEGVSYYRLRQTDFDGQYALFESVRVDRGNELNAIRIYPNPSNGYISIQTNEVYELQVYELKVYDVSGMLVASFEQLKGNQSIQLDHLPKGFYVLQFIGEELQHTEKLMIH